MSGERLSERVAEVARLMYESDHRGARPRPEDFAHLDAAPSPTPAAEPEPEQPPAAVSGWDVSAFAALPAESQAAVVAGTAVERGRTWLELEAEAELVRPVDVHLHLTDPARYVDGAGRVDREAIRADVDRLTRERPELARFGRGPGQVSARPDTRRHVAPGQAVGARPGTEANTLKHRVAAAAAQMQEGGIR